MNIDLQGNVLIRHQSIPDCQKCEESKKILDQNKITAQQVGEALMVASRYLETD